MPGIQQYVALRRSDTAGVKERGHDHRRHDQRGRAKRRCPGIPSTLRRLEIIDCEIESEALDLNFIS